VSAFFTSVSAILAVLVLLVVIGLARRLPLATPAARIVLPIAVLDLIAQMALRHWSIAAFALLAAMIASAGALAVRAPDRTATWIALGVFAIAGLAGGFGLLAHGLCLVGETYGCGGTGPDLLAAIGWAVAWSAYGYLAWGGLRP
jgi:hypothetical protein